MTLLQQVAIEHLEWVQRNFPHNTHVEPIFGVVEEVGELCHAVLKMQQGIRGTPEQHSAAIEDAIGDIGIYLIDVCAHFDLDLEQTIYNVWQTVKQRDWQANKENGNAPYVG